MVLIHYANAAAAIRRVFALALDKIPKQVGGPGLGIRVISRVAGEGERHGKD
jgi:hypothetical protein